MPAEPIIIVGGGFAGIATAVRLEKLGFKSVLLEAAPQAGGRARGIAFGDLTVDNGQHLLIGAYENFLNLLAEIGVSEHEVLERFPLQLSMHTLESSSQSKTFGLKLKMANLTKPFHLIFALASATELSFWDKIKILKLFRFLQKKNFILENDLALKDFLIQYQQSAGIIKKLWAPLALAALSTPIEKASAQIFLNVLKLTFNQQKEHSDFLLPKTDLSQLLPEPAIAYLKKHGHSVLYNHRALELIEENGQCVGVKTNHGIFKGRAIILATPPHTSAKLLQSVESAKENQHLIENLYSFQYEVIITAYFRYDLPIAFPCPILGVLNGTAHWWFDRSHCKQAQALAVIITAPEGTILNLSHAELALKLTAEINSFYPHLGAPLNFKIITEKRAAFSCDVTIQKKRPNPEVYPQNLYLAGDYTNTGLPATLESAIQSGYKAAQLVSLNYQI